MKTTKFSFTYNGTSCHGEGDFFTEEDLPILNNYYFQWKDINEINLTYNVRRANIPELLTEGICSALWGWARTNAKQIKGLSSSSCDLIDTKAGKTIQVKACSSLRENDKVGPSSFGPDGKVSSLNSYLFPAYEQDKCNGYEVVIEREVAGIDGTYGTNVSGIFFFTPEGNYFEYNGPYIYSDTPMEINDPVIHYKGEN